MHKDAKAVMAPVDSTTMLECELRADPAAFAETLVNLAEAAGADAAPDAPEGGQPGEVR